MYGKLTLRFLSLAALCTASSVGDFVCDAAMKEEIQFAMDQLRQLSESGVYETLELVEVNTTLSPPQPYPLIIYIYIYNK